MVLNTETQQSESNGVQAWAEETAQGRTLTSCISHFKKKEKGTFIQPGVCSCWYIFKF